MGRKARRQAKQHALKHTSNVVEYNFNNSRYKKEVLLTPRNLNQETYIERLLNPQGTITFGVGPAGTGKTMLAVLAAIKYLKQGTIDKIIVTRPAVGVDDEKHGFLPGDLNAKMEPWTKPIFDVFEEYYSIKDIQGMIQDNVIEISPLAFMRGRTFKRAYIIADEMQNATPNQMKMLLTRIGDESRMAVTGDIAQTDKRDRDNGLLDFEILFNRFENSKFVDFVKFNHADIERHPAVSEVLGIYGDK
jgi:phosphate starvation-inducible PhoH-like protein